MKPDRETREHVRYIGEVALHAAEKAHLAHVRATAALWAWGLTIVALALVRWLA